MGKGIKQNQVKFKKEGKVMLIEVHMLKNYASTNLNRDEVGSPKDCVFGGVYRSRISSQCLKRSWRMSPILQDTIGKENFGYRTRQLPKLVAEKLREMDVKQEYIDAIMPELAKIGKKDEKPSESGKEKSKKDKDEDNQKTSQLIFLSDADVAAVVQAVQKLLDACDNIKQVKELKTANIQKEVEKSAKMRSITLDMALFGRMVTSNAFEDVDAAMQVAHAVSTNRMVRESDYFTAMDDLLMGGNMDEQGAGHLNETGYNSACYYIYASLDTEALRQHLKRAEDAAKSVDELVQMVIPALIRTMALTNPSGKQNSFAGHALPSAILIECKNQKIPTSMVNAFVKPVRPDDQHDLVEASIMRLAEEAEMVSRNFELEVTKRLWFCVDKYDVNLNCSAEVCETLPALVQAISGELGCVK